MAAEPEPGVECGEQACEGEEGFSTLLEALHAVPDPRHARGIRHPLGAIVGLCVVAFACGRTSLSGVSRFGRDNKGLLLRLGFKRKRSPSVPTLTRVLGAVDALELQRALAGWLAAVVKRSRGAKGRVASVDGKAVRASGAHVLNVFLHDIQMVAWAAPVERKANEITAFKAAVKDLVERYPFLELFVGDAMFAGAPLCELLIQNGRHYLFQVKADQPVLLEKLELVFAPRLHAKPKHRSLTVEKKRRLCGGA